MTLLSPWHLQDFFPNAKLDEIACLDKQKKDWLSQPKKGFLRYRSPLEQVADIRASTLDFSSSAVQIGAEGEISAAQKQQLHTVLQEFMPWRKGPFSLFGIDLDAEWRSNKKWDRIVPELPDLQGKIIADIGSNNGYYMFRMAEYAPDLVLGFEPYIHHYYAFQLLNSFAQQQNLHSALFGIEHLPLFPDSFDLIFCLGILYHRPSPIDALRDVYTALRPGGTIIIESQIIPGDSPVALFPETTYAKVPGTWFVPTASCLENWMSRVGFHAINCFCTHPMSSEEQRKTAWMNFESYEDFIDKDHPQFTIEGYPAPWRAFLKAQKSE